MNLPIDQIQREELEDVEAFVCLRFDDDGECLGFLNYIDLCQGAAMCDDIRWGSRLLINDAIVFDPHAFSGLYEDEEDIDSEGMNHGFPPRTWADALCCLSDNWRMYKVDKERISSTWNEPLPAPLKEEL